MGFSKRLLEKLEARGAGQIVDRYVCVTCVRDKALKAFVRQEATRWRCDYCGMRRRSVDADDLLERIMDGIKAEYEDPANEMGWSSEEGGYIGSTIDKYELMDELDITENDALRDDLLNAIWIDEWCERHPYGLPKDERLSHGWREFSERVKHGSRFFPTARAGKRPPFPDPDDIEPADVLASLSQIFLELGLVHEVRPGTRLMRARTHDPEIVLRTPQDLGPPPPEKANLPNRMSPAGIPMFYGAFDGKTALAEVDYARSGKAATVVTFETMLPFRVVDLSDPREVPSIFDPERRYLRPWTLFIRAFVRDFSKPIARDHPEHVEYAPTQYVTEYIRFKMPGRIKGVIFPSSKVRGGRSCVLFFKNEECRSDNEGYLKANQYLKMLSRSIRRFPPLATGARRGDR